MSSHWMRCNELALDKAGFQVIRVRGSHHFLCHSDGRRTVVPVHAGEARQDPARPVGRGATRRAAGLPPGAVQSASASQIFRPGAVQSASASQIFRRGAVPPARASQIFRRGAVLPASASQIFRPGAVVTGWQGACYPPICAPSLWQSAGYPRKCPLSLWQSACYPRKCPLSLWQSACYPRECPLPLGSRPRQRDSDLGTVELRRVASDRVRPSKFLDDMTPGR